MLVTQNSLFVFVWAFEDTLESCRDFFFACSKNCLGWHLKRKRWKFNSLKSVKSVSIPVRNQKAELSMN